MAGKEKLVVARRLWHGGRFIEAGTAWDDVNTESSPVDQQVTAHYQQTGFLRSAEDLERERNAEAHEARQQAQTSEARVAELEAQVERLQGLAQGEAQEQGGKLTRLQEQVQTLTRERDEAKRHAAKPEDVSALKAYREAVGDLLPTDLSPAARKALIEHGYVGRKVLARTSDAELERLSGVAAATITSLRAFAPYSGTSEARVDTPSTEA